MISGTITLEDTTIDFTIINEIAHATIKDTYTNQTEHIEVPGPAFMKALAIAVHYDGEPDYLKDYPEAESIMGQIRWIP